VVNFINPRFNRVFYSLTAAQPAWQEIGGGSTINFSEISPGNYTFMLKAQNGDGVWNENALAFTLIVRPPFWRTWWFMVFILINAGAIAYTAVRMRIKQIMKEDRLRSEKEILKSELEKEMAGLEMSALRSQMNPHFIFNCLNSINRFILVNDNDTASEYLTKFSRLIRLVLDNSRNEKISLKKELETVNLYLEMEKLRFIDKFDFLINVKPELQTENLLIQPMLIQPYAENAIWHGLLPKAKGGRLTISIEEQNNQLIVLIRDNGIGRKKAMELKARQLVNQKSHGMKITAKRLEMLNEKLNAQSSVSITDLYDVDNQASGTLVELTLPIDYTHHQPQDFNF
jgi:LytS/YehU family sensor histidine kinase